MYGTLWSAVKSNFDLLSPASAQDKAHGSEVNNAVHCSPFTRSPM